jgi:hypothetical protein
MTTDREPVSPWPFVGMAGMASVLFVYGASVLFLPWWAVVVLVVAWVALFVVACAWWTLHPTWVPWVAVAALAVWLAFLGVQAAVSAA